MTNNIDGQYSETELLQALAFRDKYMLIDTLFPDEGRMVWSAEGGPYARVAYAKHLLHFEKGHDYKQRLFMCANRVGKTTAAGTEIVYHLTGLYPKWWTGHRFTEANDWWVAGDTTKTVRGIIQPLLLGVIGDFGSGLIPKHLLDMTYMKAAKKGETFISVFRVKHVSGAYSTVEIKTYEEGSVSFQGRKVNIWLDEEPPLDVYQECLMRTMKTDNKYQMLIMTFTPLHGPTATIENFLGQSLDYEDGEKGPGKWMTRAEMTEAPHVSPDDMKEMYENAPPHLRDAKTKGIPLIGAGLVYGLAESDIFIDRFPIMPDMARCYAIDFGWVDPTCVLWGAIDSETDTLYIYAEHYQKERPPSIHADVIKEHNKTAHFDIPGVCDPSGGGRNPNDGKVTRQTYADLKLVFTPANNALEPGITKVWDKMFNGKLKIFRTCTNTLKEYRGYRRDETGKLRGNDHAMDCLRYMVASGLQAAISYSAWKREHEWEGREDIDLPAIYSRHDAWYYT